MPDREKVIKGLECCTTQGFGCIENKKCPYGAQRYGSHCVDSMLRDALALLKAQEPRVMTLGDLRDIGSVWELNTPPYLWMDINPSYRWARGFWVAWREIYDMIDGLHPTYDADNYGKVWRCWDKEPTNAQREKVKWE